MAYFPQFRPFYEPDKEQEVYSEQNECPRIRNVSPAPCEENGADHFVSERKVQVEKISNHNDRDHEWNDQGPHGALFYANAESATGIRGEPLPRPDLDPGVTSLSQSQRNRLYIQRNKRHPGNAATRLSHPLRKASTDEDEEEKNQSRDELRKKSKQLQKTLLSNHRLDSRHNGKIVASDGPRAVRTNGGAAQYEPSLLPENNSRLLLSHNSDHSPREEFPRFSPRGERPNPSPRSERVIPSPRSERPVPSPRSELPIPSSKSDRSNPSPCEELPGPSVQSEYPNSSPRRDRQNPSPAPDHEHNGAISRQQQSGQHMKDVLLVLEDSRQTQGDSGAGGAELCEGLLGIVLCRYRQRSAGVVANGDRGEGSGSRERKVVVRSVVPGSVADRSGLVHRGDMLLYLDGQEITWSNLSPLMQNIKRKVKLTLQEPRIVGPTSCTSRQSVTSQPRPPSPAHNLCQQLIGQDLTALQRRLAEQHCVVLYLTLTSSSAEEKTPHDDIVYSFPRDEESLTAIRGMFLTVNSSLPDIVQSAADSSCLQIGEERVNIVYHQQGKDVLVISAPAARVAVCVLRSLRDEVCCVLSTLYGAVHRAFYSGETTQVDQLFALFFHRLLDGSGVHGDREMEEEVASLTPLRWQSAVHALPCVPLLQLSEENKLICDEILSELEACDFDHCLGEGELLCRRRFVLLGSALFYKSCLLTSHLRASHLGQVTGYLRCHCLLDLAWRQAVDDVVVWREVHLDPAPPGGGEGGVGDVGYTEPPARHFLLVTGMRHFLLACVLEGGVVGEAVTGKPGPPPHLLSQARSALTQLDHDDIHMSACCQHRLEEEAEMPMTVGTERFLNPSSHAKDDSVIGVKSLASKPRIEIDTVNDIGAIRRQGSKLSYGSNDSGGSGSSNGAPKSKPGRFSSLLDLSAISRSMSALHIDTVGLGSTQGKLSRGKENVLFHFLHYDQGEGVAALPHDLDLRWPMSGMSSEVNVNFHRCVGHIHALFSQDKRQTESDRMFGTGAASTRCLVEHGLLFQTSPPPPPSAADSKSPALQYWVVGRRFSVGTQCREMYVCFHESSSQVLVEMAFTLGFGS